MRNSTQTREAQICRFLVAKYIILYLVSSNQGSSVTCVDAKFNGSDFLLLMYVCVARPQPSFCVFRCVRGDITRGLAGPSSFSVKLMHNYEQVSNTDLCAA